MGNRTIDRGGQKQTASAFWRLSTPDSRGSGRLRWFGHILSSSSYIQLLHNMSIAHGIRTLGVLGAGQMGTGIALVSALRAKVPVLLHDRSPEQVAKGLSLMDKLLAKDVAKGRLTNEQAKEAKDRVTVVGTEHGIKGLRDVDMVIEVWLLCSTVYRARSSKEVTLELNLV